MPEETRNLRYKVELDTSDLENTFARIDQQVSSALTTMGMRPLDIVTGAERRFQIAEAISVPFAGRRLGLEEGMAVGAAGRVPFALQAAEAIGLPVMPILGTELIARQQQATAAAGILTQMGRGITSGNIRDLMQRMQRIDLDMPGIRATDVAMAASLLQAQPGVFRGATSTSEVEGIIRDTTQSMEVMRETLGLTTENQVRAMGETFVQRGLIERAGDISIQAATVSRLTGRGESESLSALFAAGGIAQAHNIPAEFGEGSLAIAESAINVAMRKYGLSSREVQHLGGPQSAAFRLVQVSSNILKSADVSSALAVMSDRADGKFDQAEFSRALFAGTIPTRAQRQSFIEHRFEIETKAAENPIALISTFFELREHQGVNTNKMIEQLGDILGSRKLARGALDQDAVTGGVIIAESERVRSQILDEQVRLNTVIGQINKIIEGPKKTAIDLADFVSDKAVNFLKDAIGIESPTRESRIPLVLYSETGDITLGKKFGESIRESMVKAGKGAGIKESEINRFFKDSGSDVIINIDGLQDFQKGFSTLGEQKKAGAIRGAMASISEQAISSLKEEFPEANVAQILDFVTQKFEQGEIKRLSDVEAKDIEQFIRPTAMSAFLAQRGGRQARTPREVSERIIGSEKFFESQTRLALALGAAPAEEGVFSVGAGETLPGDRFRISFDKPISPRAPMGGKGDAASDLRSAADSLNRAAEKIQ